ncbi:hypothetical protein [Streptomyces tauricus]|uniref:hypothetical protein n=1 Tax=Streptomyces tauricus TaxID=68274 RepID=UPI002244A3C8|nr:hypothetical protein [Streptomyces tauricus]MCW8101648.1 hypothetical protein [Streptomyces tauricus]
MQSTAPYTPSLLGFSVDDNLDTVINWGLGADSTAYLARMLTDPAAHGIDLNRTVVLYMATDSEWPETRLLVDIGKSSYQNLRNARSEFLRQLFGLTDTWWSSRGRCHLSRRTAAARPQTTIGAVPGVCRRRTAQQQGRPG